MENTNKNQKSTIGMTWIKSESGNTYICPAGTLKNIKSPSEEDLKRYCVEESMNPQND